MGGLRPWQIRAFLAMLVAEPQEFCFPALAYAASFNGTVQCCVRRVCNGPAVQILRVAVPIWDDLEDRELFVLSMEGGPSPKWSCDLKRLDAFPSDYEPLLDHLYILLAHAIAPLLWRCARCTVWTLKTHCSKPLPH